MKNGGKNKSVAFMILFSVVCHAFLDFNTFTGKSWSFKFVFNHSPSL